MARRLLINILLGNGDAHIKNWSLIYTDQRSPRLAPLYDVVFSAPYIENDALALNMAGSKNWQDMNLYRFVEARYKVEALMPILEYSLLL